MLASFEGLTTPTIFFTLLAASSCYWLLAFFRLYVARASEPGFVSFLRPQWIVSLALQLPEAKFFNIQPGGLVRSHFDWFMNAKSTNITVTSFLPLANMVYIGDADTTAALLERENVSWIPDVEFTGVVEVWGQTLLGSIGETWKRHRRIASASFSKSNVILVWEESRRVLLEGLFPQMDAEVSADGAFFCSDIAELCLKAGLQVISAAAFARTSPWNDNKPLPGHKHSLLDAMGGATETLFLKRVVPKWILRVTGQNRVSEYFNVLEAEMRSMIDQRRAERETGVERQDLLSRLLYANDTEEKESKRLSTEELIGDLFLFMFAGHETAGRTMGFLFSVLALLPEFQDKVFEEVSQVLSSDPGVHLSYDTAMAQLPYTRATIRETLRLWPPGAVVRRIAISDMALPSHLIPDDPNAPLFPSTLTIRKGDRISFSNGALQTNKFVWGDNADAFDPQHCMEFDKSQRLSWIPFANSSKDCIGKDFGMAEMVCFVSHTIRHYRVDLPADKKKAYQRLPEESKRAHLERVFKPSILAIHTHRKIGLTFTKRSV